MKAILVHEFGGAEVLKLEDVPTLRPAAGQVLVRISAAGVNPLSHDGPSSRSVRAIGEPTARSTAF